MEKVRNEVSTALNDYTNPAYGDGVIVQQRVNELGSQFEASFANSLSAETLRTALDQTYHTQEFGTKRVHAWWAVTRKLLGTLNEYVRVPLQNVLVQHGLGTEIGMAVPHNLYEEISAFLMDAAALVPNAGILDNDPEVISRIDDLFASYRASSGGLDRTEFGTEIIELIVAARRDRTRRSFSPDTIMQYFARVVVPTALRLPSDVDITELLSLARRSHQLMIAGSNPTSIHNMIHENDFVLGGATIARSLENPFTVAMRGLDAINLYMEDQQFVTVDNAGNEVTANTGDDRLTWIDWEDDGLGSSHIANLQSVIPDIELRDIYSCYLHCLALFQGEVISVNSVDDLKRYHSIGLAYVPALSLFDGASTSTMNTGDISLLTRRVLMFFYVKNMLSRVKGPITGELEQRYQANIFRAREAVDLEGLTRLIGGLGGWFDALCDTAAFFNDILRNRDIFVTTPKLRDKLIERLDKFIISNLSEPEKTGVLRSNQGSGYLSDINRILERGTPRTGEMNYTLEALPINPENPELPIPVQKNGQAYLTYSMLNRGRTNNFVNTVMGYLFATSQWQGSFSTETVIITNLKPLGGTDFDNFFAFLSPGDLASPLFPILHKHSKYVQVTRLQDIARLGDLNVYLQPSMLGRIGMISNGDIMRNTWVSNIPMVDPSLVCLRISRNMMIEEFTIPATDKYVAGVDWPFSMVRVVQHHIAVDLPQYAFLNDAVIAYDTRQKWTMTSMTGNRPGGAPESTESTPVDQDSANFEGGDNE